MGANGEKDTHISLLGTGVVISPAAITRLHLPRQILFNKNQALASVR